MLIHLAHVVCLLWVDGTMHLCSIFTPGHRLREEPLSGMFLISGKREAKMMSHAPITESFCMLTFHQQSQPRGQEATISPSPCYLGTVLHLSGSNTVSESASPLSTLLDAGHETLPLGPQATGLWPLFQRRMQQDPQRRASRENPSVKVTGSPALGQTSIHPPKAISAALCGSAGRPSAMGESLGQPLSLCCMEKRKSELRRAGSEKRVLS